MKITIITINFNNVDGLHDTMESVLMQTYRDYEFLVIDGGSTDGSVDLIRAYSKNIDYWVSESDNGIYHAMNKGIAKAHGDYCIFMNSGDCFYNNSVLREFAIGNYQQDIITGITVAKDTNALQFVCKDQLSFLTLYRDTISHQASFIRTSLLHKYPYDEKLKIVADWKFWIQALIQDNCSHIFINEKIARIDMEGVSRTDHARRESERQRVLSECIPERILSDYKILRYADDEMIKYVAQLSKTNRLKIVVRFLLRFFCSIIR